MSAEIEFTEANFDEKTASGVSLVDFWAPWCGPCRMQGPIVEKIAEELGDTYAIGKLNVDENPSIAARYGVTGIPTIIILKDGEEADRFVGVQPEEVLVDRLKAQA